MWAARSSAVELADHVGVSAIEDRLETIRITERLKSLQPADMDAEYRESCLPGTRVDILQHLFTSLIDPNPGPSIIWLRGMAGSGKSTILNSVARLSSELHRGGTFLFWDRYDPLSSEPRRVIRTLAYQLAQFNFAFAAELVSRIEASPGIVEASLPVQFQLLLQEPLALLASRYDLGPIIIVLDALDECGTPDTREGLLHILSDGCTKLPSMFRLLISSRDERDIHVALFPPRAEVHILDVPIGDESTAHDVGLFLRQRLSTGRGKPPDWPGADVIQRLTDRAGGLFIWASTTANFIVESEFPERRLNLVLDASRDAASHHHLYDLYMVTLNDLFHAFGQDELNVVYSVLGTLVVAFERLGDEQLSLLLELEPHVVRNILSQLQSLLQWRQGKPIQFLHTSLVDFLRDPEQNHDQKWNIDVVAHHHHLASACLRLMRRYLRFNVYGITTSYYRNQEIDAIQERIDRYITPLMYASQYWADHLAQGAGLQYDGDEVAYFIYHQFLFWLEVFSFQNLTSLSSVILRTAIGWCRVNSPPHK